MPFFSFDIITQTQQSCSNLKYLLPKLERQNSLSSDVLKILVSPLVGIFSGCGNLVCPLFSLGCLKSFAILSPSSQSN